MLHAWAVGLGWDGINQHVVVRGKIESTEASYRVASKGADSHHVTLNWVRFMSHLSVGLSGLGWIMSDGPKL